MNRRLPAYGRDLLEQRMAGAPVAACYVVCTARWTRRPDTPHVYVGADWSPDRTDWSPLAGLAARIVLRHDWPRPWADVLMLTAEIAVVAAPVHVHWVDDLGHDCVEAEWIMARHTDAPALWTPTLAADYRARANAWMTAPLDTEVTA